MNWIYNFTLIFVTLCNAFLSYLIVKYRRMFDNQHKNLLQMNDICNKYQEQLEKIKNDH
jgi:hypothetical membrane protein